MTEDTLKNIYKLYHKELVWYASNLVGEFYSQDIVADAFIQAWEMKIEDTNIRYYLYQSVKFKCLDALTRAKRVNRPREEYRATKYAYLKCNTLPPDIKEHLIKNESVSEEYADQLIIKSQLLAIIKKKVEKLPPERRKVFDLFYLQELSVNEIASILKISVDTIRVQKGRIVKEFTIFGSVLFNKPSWVVPAGQSAPTALSKRYKKDK